jgi:hypothetical protein
MGDAKIRPVLSGQRALVVGVANELIDTMDVWFTCAFRATSFAKRLTGGTSSWMEA